jgi:hypothetical protein
MAFEKLRTIVITGSLSRDPRERLRKIAETLTLICYRSSRFQ